ncbi:MAG: AAA-like domain-containing protein [Gammaproteobacteria bacterium]|nr:AAA-like domain-containing protein [Gammaproteobacteria bacterium]
MKFFNTAGPMVPEDHYCIDPLERINRKEILNLIDQKKYFVMHAPRQTGKTSCLLALRNYLNASGNFYCVYVNVEDAQAAREDVERGIRTILSKMEGTISINNSNIYPLFQSIYLESNTIPAHNALGRVFQKFSSSLDKPLVIFFDEIDSLVGDTLISVLRQLRGSYENRPKNFPQSIILCGIRDVRDYRIHSDKEKAIITGGSAFNIRSESLRLGDFSEEETKKLYLEHTKETGQIFNEDVFPYVFKLTEGQPWLVNALAYETCFKLEKDRSKPITKELIEEAKENMILRRDTHIDILIDKLSEDRVRRVIDPILCSDEDSPELNPNDVSYVIDMGLIKKKLGKYVVSNAIYREIIPRELIQTTQYSLEQDILWYTENNKLRMDKLLERFQEFFRENSEAWLERFAYKEAGPHLLLMAFLQRVLNGGGRIFREYGLGMKRMDILVEYHNEKFALELKILRNEKTKEEGLKQLKMYMDKSAAKDGHLIIFNKSKEISWGQKIYKEQARDNITIWGM